MIELTQSEITFVSGAKQICFTKTTYDILKKVAEGVGMGMCLTFNSAVQIVPPGTNVQQTVGSWRRLWQQSTWRFLGMAILAQKDRAMCTFIVVAFSNIVDAGIGDLVEC